MTDAYFFDSYALIEILEGNPAYAPYTSAGLFTTKLNLFEVYYALLRKGRAEEAEAFIEKYYPYVIDFDAYALRTAAAFRAKHHGRKLSMTDCIGYTLANILGIPFLTGDREFHDAPNVAFVK